MKQRSLHEQPYTSGPYETIAVDLPAAGNAQRIVVQLLDHGISWRDEPESWHHPHPSCDRLFCFTEGRAEVETADGRQRLLPGRIHLLPEGHPFTITYARSRLYYRHLRTLDAIALPLFRHAPSIHTLDEPALFADLIAAEDRGDRPLHLSRILECAFRFAAELAPTTPAPDAERFAPLFAHLDDHLDPDTRIGELAAIMDMNQAALSKAFQRSIGVPLKHYLQTRLMDRAKQALLYGTATVEQVADELGYHDPFYFSRAFKRFCGTSPSAFRKLNREPTTEE